MVVFNFGAYIRVLHSDMLRLMRQENLPGVEAVTIATQWVQLDYLRNAMTLVAWLSALKAFALFHQRGG